MVIAVAPTKRSIMALYSGNIDAYSHRIRIVLAEKSVTVDIFDIDKNPKAREELHQLNPYGTAPLLVDRDLVLYQSELIMEYLDERFPHPPLFPVYPIARARTRLMMYRINRDWYSLMDKILAGGETGEGDPNAPTDADVNALTIAKARKDLAEGLTSVAPVFNEMPFFLSEEFSLVDCCLAPLLWRLTLLKVELPHQAKSVLAYADRLFSRESFVLSLTESEKAMRK